MSSRQRNCVRCGAAFHARYDFADRAAQKFCSRECYWAEQQERRVRKPKACAHCGSEFTPWSSLSRYCSNPCAGAAHSEERASTYPPKDEIERLYHKEALSDRELGARFGHGGHWAATVRRHYGIAARRSRIKKPLSQKHDAARWSMKLKLEPGCRNCGRSDRKLGLHHAIPRSMCLASKYDLRNGVPLCTPCHLGWHRRLVTLYRDIFTEEEWAYISSVQLTGQNIMAWLDDRYPPRPADGGEVGVTRCKRGHPFDETNTYVNPRGQRQCRACRRARDRAKLQWALEQQFGPREAAA